jgi:CHAD domain-containing protein
MADSYLEREIKLDVGDDFVMPDLIGLKASVVQARTATYRLRSEYYDTADRALLRAHLTLRRRSGDHDAGWQLKVPRGSAREELRLPAGAEDDGVPDELAGLLLGVRRGQPLHSVAVLTTVRTVTELLDADGHTLAEVADDQVQASGSGGDSMTPSSWRELEVELGSGGEKLLTAAGRTLIKAGAVPSASSSKLARAVGVVAEPAEPLSAYLIAQQQAMLAGDLALRRDDDAVIHDTRVAIRRLRSTLRSFGSLFNAPADLDSELRWIAGLMGEVRDRQVMDARLSQLVAELDDALVIGPVRSRIHQEMQRERDEHWAVLQAALKSDRYLRLLASVDTFVTAPAWTAGTAPGAKRIAALAERADRKAVKRLAAAGADPVLLHGARKAAKRARYAGELAGQGGDAVFAQQVKRNRATQDRLGEHQDSIVTAELLHRLGMIAGTTPGENGFTFGMLYEREMARASQIRQGLG